MLFGEIKRVVRFVRESLNMGWRNIMSDFGCMLIMMVVMIVMIMVLVVLVTWLAHKINIYCKS